jgi:hypothetical protein
MHGEAFEFVKRAAEFGPFRDVVEVGGRDVNGTVRPLFVGAAYTSIDLCDGPGVDVVADAADWQPPFPVDCVVCAEVLEHSPDARLIVLQAYSWLESPGVFIMTCATTGREPHSAVDGALLGPGHGEHYRNVGAEEFESWLEAAGFAVWELEVNLEHHDLYAVAWK